MPLQRVAPSWAAGPPAVALHLGPGPCVGSPGPWATAQACWRLSSGNRLADCALVGLGW